MAHSHSNLTPSEQAEAAMDPYEQMPQYAVATVCFLGASIALFGLINIGFRLSQGNGTNTLFNRRLVALGRYFSAKQQRFIGFQLPVLGSGLLILILSLFIFVWTFAKQPYYVSRWNITGPPLAVRTGFFALGLFPFILAFGAKWNIISFIVGVSHEKLQVFHQWISHIFFILSLLHTFPWAVAGLREIRPDSGGLTQLAWSWKIGKVYYWSGTAALIPLAWLCWASFSPIRNRYYETFKLFHLISAALFFAFFFIHCNRLLGSWDYLIASAAIYAFSVFARFGVMFYSSTFNVPRAQLSLVAPGVVQISVKASSRVTWKPSQHFFFNFVTHRPLQSHPFTVSSIKEDGKMVVYLRQLKGMTEGIGKLVGKEVPVLLDGPYGGFEGDLTTYENVMMIAGGIGITATVPLLRHLARLPEDFRPRVSFVWALRRQPEFDYFRPQLDSLQQAYGKRLAVYTHVTGLKSNDPEVEVETKAELDGDAASAYELERPKVASIIPAFVEQSGQGSVAVVACGPDTLTFDVRNSVADVQLEIFKGRVKAREVYLYTEAFGW